MKTISSWSDVDLSKLTLEPSITYVAIELTNNYNGEDLAKIVCRGILQINMDTCLGADAFQLPVFVGKVQVSMYAGKDANEILQRNDYRFQIGEKDVLMTTAAHLFHVEIEGGEIEISILATECDIKE